jgi:hypothetical protein
MATTTTSRVSGEGTRVGRVAAGRSREVAGQTAEEAQNVASAAAERGGELVRSAAEDARQIAGSVGTRLGEVTDQLSSQGRSLVEDTRTQLQTQARSGTERVAGTIRQFGEQAQALAEGRPHHAPQLTDYAWKIADSCYGAADKIHGIGDDIQENGFGGVLEDLQGFARRRPGTFLLGALALGFGVGRLVKANNEMEDEEEEDERASPSGRAAPARSRATR